MIMLSAPKYLFHTLKWDGGHDQSKRILILLLTANFKIDNITKRNGLRCYIFIQLCHPSPALELICRSKHVHVVYNPPP